MFFSFAAVQRLLVPKYAGEVREGALIGSFYDEKIKDFDVLILGDCEVYENISPVTLWENYGINSFIRGSAKQTAAQSYYLLEETLDYCKPDIVVFNILSLTFSDENEEAYNRMTLDGMRWSNAKVKAMRESMTESESFLSYVFPILRYHDRWKELSGDDFKYFFKNPEPAYNGYLMNTDAVPALNVPNPMKLGDYSFNENAVSYLEKIRMLCEENGIALLLIKAPTLYPHWYDEYEEQALDYANEHDLQYINYLDLADATGIDYTTDTYDAGMHLNVYGAEKLSLVLGKTLSEEYGIADRRGDAKLDGTWNKKTERYNTEKRVKLER